MKWRTCGQISDPKIVSPAHTNHVWAANSASSSKNFTGPAVGSRETQVAPLDLSRTNKASSPQPAAPHTLSCDHAHAGQRVAADPMRTVSAAADRAASLRFLLVPSLLDEAGLSLRLSHHRAALGHGGERLRRAHALLVMEGTSGDVCARSHDLLVPHLFEQPTRVQFLDQLRCPVTLLAHAVFSPITSFKISNARCTSRKRACAAAFSFAVRFLSGWLSARSLRWAARTSTKVAPGLSFS